MPITTYAVLRAEVMGQGRTALFTSCDVRYTSDSLTGLRRDALILTSSNQSQLTVEVFVYNVLLTGVRPPSYNLQQGLNLSTHGTQA